METIVTQLEEEVLRLLFTLNQMEPHSENYQDTARVVSSMLAALTAARNLNTLQKQ